MRILHFADSYLPRVGGIETLVRELCRAQSARGHYVAVATGALPGHGRDDVIDGVAVFRRPAEDQELVRDPRLLVRFVENAATIKRRFRPDIVHVHGWQLSAWLNILSGTPMPHATLVTLHGSLKLPHAVQERVLAEAEIVTAVSASLRNEFAEIFPTHAKSIRILYNGVAAPALQPNPLVFRPPTALCYGRLVGQKGFDIALRAFANIPDLRIIVAGDGNARSSLEQLADKLGLSDRIQFRGFVAPGQVPRMINEATFVVMPSRWSEPFGLVAVESALMGRPIVASRIGGIPEVVDEKETGLLVPVEDPTALAAAVTTLLRDPARTQKMGAQARERALRRFSIERCADEFEELYGKACQNVQ
jgi:glycogen synthase